jgi:hypothetical protein
VNTLALAYAGAALPVLILFVQSRQSLGAVANSETVAVEIVRTLVGSIGLVASVPLTTWLATRVVTTEPPRRGRGRPPGNEPPSSPSGERAPAGGVTPPAASEPVEEDLPPEQQFWGRRRDRSGEQPPVPPEHSG